MSRGQSEGLKLAFNFDHLRSFAEQVPNQAFATPHHRGRCLKVGDGNDERFSHHVWQLVISPRSRMCSPTSRGASDNHAKFANLVVINDSWIGADDRKPADDVMLNPIEPELLFE